MGKTIAKIIYEIAQELDCGNDCFYNSKTYEIIAIPNSSLLFDGKEFEELFQPDLDKINQSKEDFIKIEVLKSNESFKIMEQFIEQIQDQKFRSKLELILENRKPFRNFMDVIDHSDFRQDWFDFKQNQLEKIVEKQINQSENQE